MGRKVFEALLFAAALMTAACGGGGGASHGSATTPTTSPAPGANVDPNANGVYTGPINRAKQVGQQSDARNQQVDSQGGGYSAP